MNVTPDCLRKWERSGKITPLRTVGGHRRYDEDELKRFIGIPVEDETEKVVCATYARVTSEAQRTSGDLDRQSQRLSEYCAKKDIHVGYIIKDVGSGLNDSRTGFNQLTDLITTGKVNLVVVEYKDRLTRFQFNFIKKMYETYGCNIEVINGVDVSDTEELATDMMSLLASFSGKFYGKTKS